MHRTSWNHMKKGNPVMVCAGRVWKVESQDLIAWREWMRVVRGWGIGSVVVVGERRGVLELVRRGVSCRRREV